jgi:hypothetical protein
MMIVNDNSSITNKLGASLTDDARAIIYDCNMFIVQATVVMEEYALKNVNTF